VRVCYYLSRECREYVAMTANALGLSRSMFIRSLILAYMERVGYVYKPAPVVIDPAAGVHW